MLKTRRNLLDSVALTCCSVVAAVEDLCSRLSPLSFLCLFCCWLAIYGLIVDLLKMLTSSSFVFFSCICWAYDTCNYNTTAPICCCGLAVCGILTMKKLWRDVALFGLTQLFLFIFLLGNLGNGVKNTDDVVIDTNI